MLTFEDNKSTELVKLITWDQVAFIDGEENKYPVKKIVITMGAGEVVIMDVERYVDGNGNTSKGRYFLEAVSDNIKLKVKKES